MTRVLVPIVAVSVAMAGLGTVGADPAGATGGQTPQTITLTSHPPSSMSTGGTWGATATGGGSGNPVVFTIDPSTTNLACSLGADGATVSVDHFGVCIVDANQAGDAVYAPAPQVQTNVVVVDSAITIPPTSPGIGYLLYPAQPTVDSISKHVGSPGDTITINGAHLTDATAYFVCAKEKDFSGTMYWTLFGVAAQTSVLSDGDAIAVVPSGVGPDYNFLLDCETSMWVTAGTSAAPGTVTYQPPNFVDGNPKLPPNISPSQLFAYNDHLVVSGCIPAIPPILGNQCTGTQTVPQAVADFEANAANEVLALHGLTASQYDVMKWSRSDVVGQEWMDLARIITKDPNSLTDNERAVYRWFQGTYLRYQHEMAQGAVNEYLKWSGLDMAHIDDEPLTTGFCKYTPPDGGGETGWGAYTWAGHRIPLCYAPCELLLYVAGTCGVVYPSLQDFETWGAYAAQSHSGLTSPDVVERIKQSGAHIGFATTDAQQPGGTLDSLHSVLGSDGKLNATGLLLKHEVLPGVLSMDRLALNIASEVALDIGRTVTFPSTLIADSLTVAASVSEYASLISALGVASWAAIGVAIVLTTVLGSLKLAQDKAVHTTLVDALDKTTSAIASFNQGGVGPDLHDMMVNQGATNALYMLFVAQTVPDVALNCAGWTTKCVEIDPPIPGPSPSDPQFRVIEQGSTQSNLNSSLYSASPWGPAELVRISNESQFVVQKYDAHDPANLDAPTGTAGGLGTGLTLDYKAWDGKAWSATIEQDPRGGLLFSRTPLDPSDQDVCTDPTTGPTCVSPSLQYTEPNGHLATATFATSAPEVTASVPTHASSTAPVNLSASATSSTGGPFTYAWSWTTTDAHGQTISGGASGQVVTSTFAANVNPWNVTVSATDTSSGAVVSTRSPLISSSPTSLTLEPNAPGGHLLTGGAPVTFSAIIAAPGCVGPPLCVGPTGRAQFFLDGRSLGDPVNVAPIAGTSIGLATLPPVDTLPATVQASGHVIDAYYIPDSATFAGSSTRLAGVAVAPGDTNVTLQHVVYPTDGSFANPTPLTAHIVAKAPSTVPPTGNIQFWVQTWHFAQPVNASEATLAGIAPIDSQGNATLPGTVLPIVGPQTPWDKLVVYAEYYGDSRYGRQQAPASPFAPTQAFQSIAFDSAAPTTATVSGSPYSVSATGGGSGNPVVFSIDASTTNHACSLGDDGSTVRFGHAGNCVVDANQAGNASYVAAAQVQQSFAVGQGAQSIAFSSAAPTTARVGGSSYSVSATGGDSGKPVVFSIDALTTNQACSLGADGSTVSFAHAGTCVIDANQAGNADYLAAAQAQQSFNVGRASQHIAFDSTAPTAAKVGGSSYSVSATGGSSGSPVVFSIDALTTNQACSLGADGSTVSFAHAGTCVVDADQAGNADYAPASQVQQSFTVRKATPTLTWPTPSPIVFGTKLGFTQLNATASVPGTFVYSPPAGSVLTPGVEQVLAVTFTPTNTADYTTASASVKINVVLNPASCITKSFSGPLTIAAGQAYCVASGGTITNGITVTPGGALYMTGGTIKGSLTVGGATAVTLCGVSISGGITITGSTGPLAIGTCGKNTVSGSVSITSNTGGLIYNNTVVSGSLTLTGNSGGFGSLTGNKTSGTVTIKNNS